MSSVLPAIQDEGRAWHYQDPLLEEHRVEWLSYFSPPSNASAELTECPKAPPTYCLAPAKVGQM